MSDFPPVTKSPNDHRQYQFLTLKNKLRVLLVEDMQTTQAAASMAVEVGHFDDPQLRPGMAHFLEHMLFLGTEKFPQSGEYNAFINQHGGNNNAWTGTEHTNFFYNIDANAFAPSLDRFSQFFIAPKFDVELVDRERQAIESEYSLKLKDDVRRIYQVQKESINQQHPFSKFSVGNLATLSGTQQELRDELITFYQTHYSANIMTLCLVAPLTLTKQVALVEHYFSAIENKNIVKQHPEVPFIDKTQNQTQIDVLPLKEQKRVAISFCLPGIDKYYCQKPLTFISHLLGNEGPGSLLAYLKEQNWANNLSAGGGVNGYNFKDYTINIQLTERGLTHLDDVISCIFEYINLIKHQGIEDWRYQERANLLQTAFKFQEQIKPLDLASHLSINMHHYAVEDTIYGDYRMDTLNQQETLELLNALNVDNMRIQLVNKQIESSQTANWYHTPYSIKPISALRLNKWRHSTTPRNQLKLPAKNPFIVVNPQTRTSETASEVPKVVAEGKGYRIWHRKDDEFNVPKGHLFLSLDSVVASPTPRHAALTRLYVEMVLDYLSESTYQAEVAGLHYNIYPHQGGLTLHLTGFSGNQETLLSLIINKARERNFTQSRFDVIKKQILRSWYNAAQAKPISQLFTSLTVTLQKRSYEPLRMAQELETIQLDDLHNHVSQFYDRVYLEGLVYGDWLVEEAQQLGRKLEALLTLVSKPSQESSRELVNLQHQKTLLREKQISHQDSAIIVYYQSASTTAINMALFSLLNHTMSSSFFHELRTQQQLGYMVGTGYLPLNRHPGIIFYIQSPGHGPRKLLEAIDEFIADFGYAVMQMTNEQWQMTKQGLQHQVMEHDPNLKTRGQRYWVSLGNRDYQFNHRESVVAEIEKLTRADLIKFIMNNMRSKTCDRLVLFNQGESHLDNEPLRSANMIKDLKQFKANAEKFAF
ncbi:insulinase family protein [Shewanella intestini]|uniref:Protease 3 n=1 Tax=Shewanella intestini TaxID=2017544 RepID=A0ABS5I0W6_9GAMM|nr:MULTISPECIES: insulinase family protein [Shewanella]MBR9727473.1 insulinase family protein [Shewanella intestini]MRG35477.1 insulinase family protein [Shewanella sp. XMDDZSB0408]